LAMTTTAMPIAKRANQVERGIVLEGASLAMRAAYAKARRRMVRLASHIRWTPRTMRDVAGETIAACPPSLLRAPLYVVLSRLELSRRGLPSWLGGNAGWCRGASSRSWGLGGGPLNGVLGRGVCIVCIQASTRWVIA
jgi:hypothetical protein